MSYVESEIIFIKSSEAFFFPHLSYMYVDSNLSDTHKKTKVSGPRDEDLHLNLLTIHDMFQIFSSHDIYCEVRFYLQFLFLNLLSFFPVKNKIK